MVLAGILSASSFSRLFTIDLMIAISVQLAGCPDCKGRLHASHYRRKPRGHPEHLESLSTLRLSWCCGREGCRKRLTPPSVRFSGRLVYTAPTVLALQSTHPGTADEAHLRDTSGCSRQSVRRWRDRFGGLWETPVGRMLAGSFSLNGHERKQSQRVLGCWHGCWPYLSTMWQLLIHPLTGGKRWETVGLAHGSLDPQQMGFAIHLAALQDGLSPP